MGFFDSKWIVEFEYSTGFISSYKKGTMVVEASSEYSAKDKAKAVLKANFKFVKVLSARKSEGRNDERNVSFVPPVTTTTSTYTPSTRITEPVHSSSESYSSHRESRPLSKEELEEIERRAAERRAEAARIEKENKISAKEKQIKKIKSSPVRNMIIGYFASLVAFLFGWIPHWVCKVMEKGSRSALEMWIELGHSATDDYGQELTAEISQHQAAANGTLWIPFAMLGIGIVISIVIFFVTKNKVPAKLNKAEKELSELKSL